MSYEAPFNTIDYVEVDDDTISMFENEACKVVMPKSALSVMIMHYENILLDLEEKSTDRKKYYSDESTVIYAKRVIEIDEFDRRKNVERRVLCIVNAPFEVVLRKEEFQMMLISAAVSCRIKADKFRSSVGPEYGLNSTKLIIFHNSQHFSIIDETGGEQFAMPIAALAKMIMLKKEILRDLDLRSKNYFGKTVYWSNHHFQIKSEHLGQFRVLSFVAGYQENNPDYIRIRDETFLKMVHISTSGPASNEDVDDTMENLRELFWKSIPINTYKSIDFSRDGKEFTLINEANGETLTLPVSALKAAERSKNQILSDLKDMSFMPSYRRDFMNEYWSDGVYAIRTGAFINLSRDIDCNVVRFTRIKDNYYKFVIQKKAFLSLLDELKNLEYY